MRNKSKKLQLFVFTFLWELWDKLFLDGFYRSGMWRTLQSKASVQNTHDSRQVRQIHPHSHPRCHISTRKGCIYQFCTETLKEKKKGTIKMLIVIPHVQWVYSCRTCHSPPNSLTVMLNMHSLRGSTTRNERINTSTICQEISLLWTFWRFQCSQSD